MLMENFLWSKEYWTVVEAGVPELAAGLDAAQRAKIENEKLKDLKAKNYLFQAIDWAILETFLNKNDDASLFMVCHPQEASKKNLWYLDIGYSNHMCGDKSVFSYLDEYYQDKVKFGDNSTIAVKEREKTKSETLAAFKFFKVLAENKASRSVKVLHIDRGGEFNLKEFADFCESNGIKRQLTVAYTPQQNGTAKESLLAASKCSTGGSLPTSLELESGSSSRPQRKKRRLTWLEDYEVTNLPQDDVPINHFALFAYCDPLTYEEAVKEEKWQKAMTEEIGSIERNQTWKLTDLPEGHRTIGVKWIYKTKLKENGEVDKFKARLMAKGHKQEFGIDYQEVFAPIARMDTIKLVIALAAQNSWPIYQLDVNRPFCMEIYKNM
ncbi:hypothetical protein SLEP1_g4195 [Rubroshorea leprosula]|uniref:Integrase catalytic domain-containing protein n=1 Tax=Rubroshorea leprosula TaxID=152421 RepID=A0AAV5HMW5_9ROSI|nr:hypothetical protein SLEP1_g4195 [Rubroshorea leprosula]